MKITKSKLRQLIKEELDRVIAEQFDDSALGGADVGDIKGGLPPGAPDALRRRLRRGQLRMASKRQPRKREYMTSFLNIRNLEYRIEQVIARMRWIEERIDRLEVPPPRPSPEDRHRFNRAINKLKKQLDQVTRRVVNPEGAD